ncbi:hypothetical protein [uncultured Anaerococcus sp.]|uniref:hypothetical protein n=1 Tax=uncultured Anaerococcus sp. TaxID=293428 RepID=UPI00280AF2E8|nr:hypothetical protein [uncultured Anaerococcus sp.]
MKESFEILILVAVGVVSLFLIRELIKQGKALNEQVEDEKLKFVFGQVLDLAETIVNSLNQTVVEPLKNSEKLEFDKKAQKEVLERAKGRIKDNLDAKSKDLLKAYLGLAEKVDDFIKDAVESKVYESKK